MKTLRPPEKARPFSTQSQHVQIAQAAKNIAAFPTRPPRQLAEALAHTQAGGLN